MNTPDIDRQYPTRLTRPRIAHALTDAGKDLDHLQPQDLDTLEDFHTSRRID